MAPLGIKLTFLILMYFFFAANAADVPPPPTGYLEGVPVDWPGTIIQTTCQVTFSACTDICNGRRGCIGFYFRPRDGCCFAKGSFFRLEMLFPHWYAQTRLPLTDGNATFVKSTAFANGPPLAPPGYGPAVPGNWPGNNIEEVCHQQVNISVCANSCDGRPDCIGFYFYPRNFTTCCYTKKLLPGFPYSGASPAPAGSATYDRFPRKQEVPPPPLGYERGVPNNWPPIGFYLVEMKTYSTSECAALCKQRPVCSAFHFRPYEGWCYVSTTQGPFVPDRTPPTANGSAIFVKLTTALGYEKGVPVEWPGNEISMRCTAMMTSNECADDCNRAANCVGFFRRRVSSDKECCWLKYALSGYPSQDGIPTTDGGETFARISFSQAPAGYSAAVAADWPGNDLLSTCGVTIAQAANTCNTQQACAGFFWRPADRCAWFESDLRPFPLNGTSTSESGGVTFKKEDFK